MIPYGRQNINEEDIEAVIDTATSRPDDPKSIYETDWEGKLNLKDLYQIAIQDDETKLESGKQELFENIVNQYI